MRETTTSSSLRKKQSLKSRKLQVVRCCDECIDTECVVMLDENGHPIKQIFCLCDLRDNLGRGDVEQFSTLSRLLKIELTNKSVNDKSYSEPLRQLLEITSEESAKDSPRCVKPTQVCQYYVDYCD